jgi:hypothetical protein
MISLEVSVNGQRRTVAGIAEAELLNATVSLYPNVKDGWLDVSGSVVPEGQPPADASWLAAALAVGDVVEVRLIDSGAAQTPKLTRVDPTAAATDEVPFVCAFCEKTHLEITGMVASRRAMICPECVGYLHEMMNAPKNEGDEA